MAGIFSDVFTQNSCSKLLSFNSPPKHSSNKRRIDIPCVLQCNHTVCAFTHICLYTHIYMCLYTHKHTYIWNITLSLLWNFCTLSKLPWLIILLISLVSVFVFWAGFELKAPVYVACNFPLIYTSPSLNPESQFRLFESALPVNKFYPSLYLSMW